MNHHPGKIEGVALVAALIVPISIASVLADAAPRGTVFAVENTYDSGLGSLRQAILDANAVPGADTIVFDIPFEGPHVIELASPLPTITDTVTIDGYVQPGTNPGAGDIASLQIVIDGAGAGHADGLTLAARNSIVRGLVLRHFDGNGLSLTGAGENLVEDNLISDNAGAGIGVLSGSGNRITGNSIFSNGGGGIDLAADGQNEIDLGDVDDGPNDLQNAPDLRSVRRFHCDGTDADLEESCGPDVRGWTAAISGTIESLSNETFSLEFFATPPSESGVPAETALAASTTQGKTFLGEARASTGPDGRASFTINLPTLEAIPSGTLITATATDSRGNTSEYSNVVAAPASVISWAAAVSGNWNDPTKWTGGVVPGGSDDAQITVDGTYTVTLDVNATAGSLMLGGSSGVQTLSSVSHTFTLNGPSTIGANGSMDFESGTLAGAGPLTNQRLLLVYQSTIDVALDNQGTVQWQASSYQNGVLTTAAGSVLRLEGLGSAPATLTVANGFTNNGTIELTDLAVGNPNDAHLVVTSGVLVNAAGHAINALAGAGGGRYLKAALDNHGTVTVDRALVMDRPSSAHVNESDGTILVSGGNLTVIQSGTSPSFTNNGTITVSTGRTLAVSGGALTLNGSGVTGAGEVTLVGGVMATLQTNQSTAVTPITYIEGATLTGPGSLTNGAGKTLLVYQSTIDVALDNQGTVQWQASSYQNGVLTTAAGSVLRLEGLGSAPATLTVANGFTNNGTIELTDLAVGNPNDAHLVVTSGVLVNAAGHAINALAGAGGGRYLKAALDNHGTVTVDRALVMDRPSSAHVNESDGTILVSGGNLTVIQSGTSPSFTNNGTITVSAGRTLTTNQTYAQMAGTTRLEGGTLASDVLIDIQGGSLTGTGTVNGNLQNAGQVAPGLSPGLLGVAGIYTQASAGSFAVEIGGLTAGTGHDRLDVSGVAILTGALQATLVNGFIPNPGDELTILTCGSRIGTFTTASLPSYPGIQWRVDYFDTAVKLVVLLVPAGRVPGDLDAETPLIAAKSGSNLKLTWAGTCMPGDIDFAVYEGVLGNFTGHVPVLCSTSGATTATFAPAAGDRYYLVAAHNGHEEGSYGYDSTGAQRALSVAECHPQHIASCP